jgi:AraC-like DNA-binding protein
MNSSRRVVFGNGQRGGHSLIPEILETGWGSFAVADLGHLRPHAHIDAFEFCLILTGEVEWSTATSSEILREGDVYISQPNETHWGRDAAMHPCTLHWLILGSPRCGFDWAGMDSEWATQLDNRLRAIQARRLRRTPKLSAAIQEIFDEHTSGTCSSAQTILQRANARAALQRFLIELIRIYERRVDSAESSDPRQSLPPETARAIEILHQSTHDPNVVRQCWQYVGTDYKTLNQQFVDHLGATISQYWLRQRVRLARERLRNTNVTVTDVATELGFSSSQHFSTVFRKITGLTPSEYRRDIPIAFSESAPF